IVLAATAVGGTLLGGWPFALLWTAAALVVAYEWQTIIRRGFEIETAAPALAGVAALVLSAAFASPFMTLAGFAFAAAAIWRTPASERLLAIEGIVYASTLGVAAILCRRGGYDGAVVIFWLFAAVWGTDTLAYFTGRKLGGPKLWPSVSPKKTWSGAIGGLIGGAALGLVVLLAAGVQVGFAHVMLSVAFSVCTQAGDLFESSLKRRFDVKDASRIIPGHGGVMDRLDGFIFALGFAALVGVLRGGWDGAAAGLLHWG
ncbi:MAG: phosphatidate cytidylyltransferase, partial [Beijerinckiaceae bacterium]